MHTGSSSPSAKTVHQLFLILNALAWCDGLRQTSSLHLENSTQQAKTPLRIWDTGSTTRHTSGHSLTDHTEHGGVESLTRSAEGRGNVTTGPQGTQNESLVRFVVQNVDEEEKVFECGLTGRLRGFVHTEGFYQRKSFFLKNNWTGIVTVIGPSSHVVMYNVTNTNQAPCMHSKVEIYAGRGAELTSTACQMNPRLVRLVQDHVLQVHWRQLQVVEGEIFRNPVTGFRLDFSFHKTIAAACAAATTAATTTDTAAACAATTTTTTTTTTTAAAVAAAAVATAATTATATTLTTAAAAVAAATTTTTTTTGATAAACAAATTTTTTTTTTASAATCATAATTTTAAAVAAAATGATTTAAAVVAAAAAATAATTTTATTTTATTTTTTTTTIAAAATTTTTTATATTTTTTTATTTTATTTATITTTTTTTTAATTTTTTTATTTTTTATTTTTTTTAATTTTTTTTITTTAAAAATTTTTTTTATTTTTTATTTTTTATTTTTTATATTTTAAAVVAAAAAATAATTTTATTTTATTTTTTTTTIAAAATTTTTTATATTTTTTTATTTTATTTATITTTTTTTAATTTTTTTATTTTTTATTTTTTTAATTTTTTITTTAAAAATTTTTTTTATTTTTTATTTTTTATTTTTTTTAVCLSFHRPRSLFPGSWPVVCGTARCLAGPTYRATSSVTTRRSVWGLRMRRTVPSLAAVRADTLIWMGGAMSHIQVLCHISRCYVFVNPHRPTSWLEANAACREKHGTYLASLNTRREWEVVTDALESLHVLVKIGLRGTDISKPEMYQYQTEWADGTLALYKGIVIDWGDVKTCAQLMTHVKLVLLTYVCNIPEASFHLCELGKPGEANSSQEESSSMPYRQVLPDPHNQIIPFPHLACPGGHVTHIALICDSKSCFPQSFLSNDDLDPPSCRVDIHPLPPSFVCRGGHESVAYTLVCDYRQDCVDGSDESFCVFQPCSGDRPYQCGTSSQCIPFDMPCDGRRDCNNESDERHCTRVPASVMSRGTPPPATLTVVWDPYVSKPQFTASHLAGPCPRGFFQCTRGGYCLELSLRCNGVADCAGRQDDAGCQDYACHGLYRCRGSRICLPDSELCDGFPKCPLLDDESFCDLECPPGCTCYGLAFFCPGGFTGREFPECRYLDASGSGVGSQNLAHNMMLVYLSLARCGLTRFTNVTLPNLLHLDLTDNLIQHLTSLHLHRVHNLRVLLLAGNPLAASGLEDSEMPGLPLTLRSLDLSRVALPVLEVHRSLPELQRLNLSATGLEVLEEPGFQALPALRALDLRACPLTSIPPGLFYGLKQLGSVRADTFRVCCRAVLPAGVNLKKCNADANSLSSCERLLKNKLHIVFVAVFAVFCVLANMVHVGVRVLVKNERVSSSSYAILLVHLCGSDFVMGVYLTVIGLADHFFQDVYLWRDVSWRHGLTCKLTGSLLLLSCEVSSFLVLSITLERLAATYHGGEWKVLPAVAHATGVVCWLAGAALATGPYFRDQGAVFSTSALCVPAPFSPHSRGYVHGVTILFLTALHALVFLLQVPLYLRTRPQIMDILDTQQRPRLESGPARCFLPVAVARCLCWISMAAVGWTWCVHPQSCGGGVREMLGVVALPLGSVLQPIMYCYGLWQERQLSLHQDRVRQFILAKRKARALDVKASSDRQNK
ncbi:hypothetical protein ACOMHN_060186 [Nucella lapillus]